VTPTHFTLRHILRWPSLAIETGGPSDACVARALAQFRAQGHCAVRMLDLQCGDGLRLIHAAEHARALGFVAIEGRGVSCSPAAVRHARRQAEAATHPSTGLIFEVAEPIGALAAEHDGAADFIFLAEPMPYPASPLHAALERIGGAVLAGS
jgi:hypothetical protein